MVKIQDYKGYEIYVNNEGRFLIFKDGNEYDYANKSEIRGARNYIDYLNEIVHFKKPKKLLYIDAYSGNEEFTINFNIIGTHKDAYKKNPTYIDDAYNAIHSKLYSDDSEKINRLKPLREEYKSIQSMLSKYEREKDVCIRKIDDILRSMLYTSED